MSEKKEELQIVYVDINEIKPTEYNPRKITPKEKKELYDSLVKYGLCLPLTLNNFKGRENILISGHQRLKIAKELGITLIPVTYETLDIEEEKELNIRLNKNTGQFDMEKLITVSDREKLIEIGFASKDLQKVLSLFEEKFNEIDTTDPVYPLAPKFNEKYDYVMIMCPTEMDFHWLKNVLEVEREIGYKSTFTGEGRVILIKKFQNLHKQWISK
jgi:hypothetical protein